MKCVLPALLVFLGLVFATAAPTVADVSDVVDEVSQAQYVAFHSSLYVSNGMSRGFTTGSPLRFPTNQHDLARDNIQASFSASGLLTERHDFAFGYGSYTYTNCSNIIGFRPGTDTNAGYYIVGAHYDAANESLGQANSPGADDNASGIAAAMEAGRVLGHHAFKSSLIFVAFDGEEEGLKGSYAFIDSYTLDATNCGNGHLAGIGRGDIRSMVSADMIAFNSTNHPDEAEIYGGSGVTGMTTVKSNLAAAVEQYGGGLLWTNKGGIWGSDHNPFAEKSIDACLLIDDHANSPYYHKTSDSVDSIYNGTNYIDYAYATKMTRSLTGYLAGQAGLVPTVSLVVTDPSASEWGTHAGCFEVRRTDVLTNDLMVYYTVSGAAAPYNDYEPMSGSVLICSGCPSAVIVVTPVADAVAEGPRDIVLTIAPDPEYGIGVATGRVTIADTPIDDWRYAHFTSNQLADVEISGDLADPDGNRVPNLMEYALGREPLATNSAPEFTTALESADGRLYFTAYYDRRTNLLDATCVVEVCTNLLTAEWFSGSNHVWEAILGNSGITERVRARVFDPAADEVSAGFLRLKSSRREAGK